MSHSDRGPYAPADRLTFDPRVPVRSGPAPVTLVASALILLGLIGGVAFVYRHGFRHAGAAPAEVGAPIAEIRAAPATASATAPALSVDKTNAAPTFAPPPEAPAARSGATPAAASAPAAAPKVVVSSLPPPVAVQPAASAAAAPARVTAAASPAPRAVAATAAPPAPPVAHRAKPITIASLADAAMADRSTPKHAAAAAPVPTTIVDTSAAKPPVGGGWVQIGAFSSPGLADKGWSDVAKLEPGGMAGKGRKFEPVQSNGKTLYRAFITGFSSRAAAQAFCDKLRADGKSCFVK